VAAAFLTCVNLKTGNRALENWFFLDAHSPNARNEMEKEVKEKS